MSAPQCSSCAKQLRRQPRSGLCRPCYMAQNYGQQHNRSCSDCSAPITYQSKLGRCRDCARARTNADPEIQRRRREAIVEKHRDPVFRKIRAALIEANFKKACIERPEVLERLRERGRELAYTALRTPEALAALAASRPRATAKIIEARIGWCPAEYREEYQHLTISKRMHAAEAKAVILAQIEADKRRLTPFERQMLAVQNGARIVAKPVLHKPDYAFTLGGVTPA